MSHPIPPAIFEIDKYWLPLEHPCGCMIDWGIDQRRASQLPGFLEAAAPYPCPMHGSITGECQPQLAIDEIRILVANNVFYRLAAADQRENAAKNRAVALGKSLNN